MEPSFENLDPETRDQVASLALKLAGNPKTRKGFLSLIKETMPNVPIPEIDTRSEWEEELRKRDEEFQKFRAEQERKEMERALAEERNRVKARYRLDDDDLKRVEQIMAERKVLNYDDAAKLYDLERQPSVPTYESSVGIAELPKYEGLMEDEHRWSIKTAHELIDQMKKGKVQEF